MSSHIDYKKFDLINQIVLRIQRAKDFSDVIDQSLRDITKIVNCDVGQCIILKPQLLSFID